MGPDEQHEPAPESPDAPTEELSAADRTADKSDAFSATVSFRSPDAPTPELTEKSSPSDGAVPDPPGPADRDSEPVVTSEPDPAADQPPPESVGRYELVRSSARAGSEPSTRPTTHSLIVTLP
jgi:hypothetical protein